MITLEAIFQGVFTGFCSYLGMRTARNTHKKVKKLSFKKYYKKFIMWLKK